MNSTLAIDTNVLSIDSTTEAAVVVINSTANAIDQITSAILIDNITIEKPIDKELTTQSTRKEQYSTFSPTEVAGFGLFHGTCYVVTIQKHRPHQGSPFHSCWLLQAHYLQLQLFFSSALLFW